MCIDVVVLSHSVCHKLSRHHILVAWRPFNNHLYKLKLIFIWFYIVGEMTGFGVVDLVK